MSILTVENLSKSYGNIKALKSINFSVPEGTVFGILGPNGSGKTTTLGIVTDILRPTSGSFKLFDEIPNASHRRRIGTLLETPNFYHYLSGRKNLEIAAEIKQHGKDDIDHVLEVVDLNKRQNSKFSTYSLGMKQRLAIGAALLGDPEVLIFDEPTNGLDPVGIAEIRELLKSLARDGKTVIMASHLLDEVEKVCTHVAILKRGEIITFGNVNEILSNEEIVEVAANDHQKLLAVLNNLPGKTKLNDENKFVNVFFPVNTSNLSEINNFCFEKGVILNHLVIRKKSLEAKFFELTNN